MSKPGDNKGEKNFKCKLTRADVISIYLEKNTTQQNLAIKYGVNQSTINHIKCQRTWKWLTSGLDKSNEISEDSK